MRVSAFALPLAVIISVILGVLLGLNDIGYFDRTPKQETQTVPRLAPDFYASSSPVSSKACIRVFKRCEKSNKDKLRSKDCAAFLQGCLTKNKISVGRPTIWRYFNKKIKYKNPQKPSYRPTDSLYYSLYIGYSCRMAVGFTHLPVLQSYSKMA